VLGEGAAALIGVLEQADARRMIVDLLPALETPQILAP
jgi:hypothetical protein